MKINKTLKQLFFLINFFSFFAGPVITYLGVLYIIEGYNTSNWSEVNAKVIKSQIDSEYSSGVGKGSGGGMVYFPAISYRYKVNSKTYIGKEISTMLLRTSNASNGQELISKYPLNSQISVFYNQNKPDEAVIEKGVPTRAYYIFFAGIFMCLFVVMSFVFRKKRIK